MITSCWISYLKSSNSPEMCCGDATASGTWEDNLLKPIFLLAVLGSYISKLYKWCNMIFKTIFLSSSTFFHPLPSITFIFIDIPLILVLTLELLAQPFGKLLFSLLSLFLILSFAGGIFESSHVSSGTTLLVHMLMISGTNFSIAVFSGIPKSMLHLAENM